MSTPIPVPGFATVRRWRFVRLVRPFLADFERFARRLARSPQDGDDLLQEAMEAALRRLSSLKHEGAFRTWMFKTIRTVHLDRLDREARHRRRVDACREAQVLPFPVSPADALEAREIGHAVAEALDRLPEEQRLAVWLVDVQGLSFGEAADVLDVRRGTLCSRVVRGRLALRQFLAPLAADQGLGVSGATREDP